MSNCGLIMIMVPYAQLVVIWCHHVGGDGDGRDALL